MISIHILFILFLFQVQKINDDGFFTLNSNHTSHRVSNLFNTPNTQQNRFSSQFILERNEVSGKDTNENEEFSKTTISPKDLEQISTDSITTYSFEESNDESERSGSYNKLFKMSPKKSLCNFHVYEEIKSPKRQSKGTYPYF